MCGGGGDDKLTIASARVLRRVTMHVLEQAVDRRRAFRCILQNTPRLDLLAHLQSTKQAAADYEYEYCAGKSMKTKR